jgi:hypothetical protein
MTIESQCHNIHIPFKSAFVKTPLVRYLRAGPTLSFGFEFSPTEGDKSTNETPPSIETMQDQNTKTKHATDGNVF